VIINRDFAPELCGNFVALPSLCSGLLTADKREIKDLPQLSPANFVYPPTVMKCPSPFIKNCNRR